MRKRKYLGKGAERKRRCQFVYKNGKQCKNPAYQYSHLCIEHAVLSNRQRKKAKRMGW